LPDYKVYNEISCCKYRAIGGKVMIFIGIFGIQDKQRVVREYPNIVCKCGRLSRGELIEHFTYFHLFFIPIFKWNRRYYMRYRCCNRIFRVPNDYAKEIKDSSDVDIDRLEEIPRYEYVSNRCSNCGAELHHSFAYCPYCGHKI